MLARLIVAVAVATLSACGGVSDSLPPAAVSATATTAVRISASGISSTTLRESAESIATQMSKSKVPQIVQVSGLLTLRAAALDPATNPAMKDLDDAMTEMRTAGVIAVWVVVDEIGQAWGLTELGSAAASDGVVVMAQTDGRAPATDIGAIASRMAKEPLAAHPLGGGWYRILQEDDSRPVEVPNASPEIAAQLDAAAKVFKDTAVSAGIRVTPEMRASFGGNMADANPMLSAFTSGFEESIASLDTMSWSLNFGTDPTLRAALSFADPKAAGSFNDAWTQALDGMAGMASMFLAAPNKEGKRAVDPAVFPQIAKALHLTQDQSRLTLTIDNPCWKKLLP
ncbi:MAG: hypothetical protein EXS03_07610 [Phycisphaerales bacterium]|nr:hypothetical protein [Phycisphaerales bacterium]